MFESPEEQYIINNPKVMGFPALVEEEGICKLEDIDPLLQSSQMKLRYNSIRHELFAHLELPLYSGEKVSFSICADSFFEGKKDLNIVLNYEHDNEGGTHDECMLVDEFIELRNGDKMKEIKRTTTLCYLNEETIVACPVYIKKCWSEKGRDLVEYVNLKTGGINIKEASDFFSKRGDFVFPNGDRGHKQEALLRDALVSFKKAIIEVEALLEEQKDKNERMGWVPAPSSPA